MKFCTKCADTKPLTEFRESLATKDGHSCWCKSCHVKYIKDKRTADPEFRQQQNKHAINWTRKHLYGMTPEQYDQMLKDQNGVCAICGGTNNKVLAVDHDHATNKVRKLLCHHCNNGLGCFRDNVQNMQIAIDYLNMHTKTKKNYFNIFE